jgi:hypothetical protein
LPEDAEADGECSARWGERLLLSERRRSRLMATGGARIAATIVATAATTGDSSASAAQSHETPGESLRYGKWCELWLWWRLRCWPWLAPA